MTLSIINLSFSRFSNQRFIKLKSNDDNVKDSTHADKWLISSWSAFSGTFL